LNNSKRIAVVSPKSRVIVMAHGPALDDDELTNAAAAFSMAGENPAAFKIGAHGGARAQRTPLKL
jgi:hypothetical protein